MFTSNFARLKSFPENLVPISIARFPPRWYGSRRRYIALAPKKEMLKMPQAEYDQRFADILAKLDPRHVFDDLGDSAVLLCWEAPGDVCHRRWVAEWLEQALGIEIPEYGIPRDQTPCYAESVAATPAQETAEPSPIIARGPQLLLF